MMLDCYHGVVPPMEGARKKAREGGGRQKRRWVGRCESVGCRGIPAGACEQERGGDACHVPPLSPTTRAHQPCELIDYMRSIRVQDELEDVRKAKEEAAADVGRTWCVTYGSSRLNLSPLLFSEVKSTWSAALSARQTATDKVQFYLRGPQGAAYYLS